MSKMTILEMKKKVEKLLKAPERTFVFDSEKKQLYIKESEEQITLKLVSLVDQYEKKGDAVFQEIFYYVTEGFKVKKTIIDLKKHPEFIFPVVRSGAFPNKNKEGKLLCFEKHTAETMIYYVYDIGHSYRFITVDLLKKFRLTKEDIRKNAFQNLKSLKNPLKKDEVAGNRFYFLQTNDGYEASRILDEKFLEMIASGAKGETVVAVPHQDVLIACDIINPTGYDLLAHMNMRFFAEGIAPITSLPFVYHQGKLEPIFILAKNNSKEQKK